MEKLFHISIWGRNDTAPGGYSFISAHTVTAIDGLHAAKRVAAWHRWTNDAWMDSPENKGRPEIIIRNDTMM